MKKMEFCKKLLIADYTVLSLLILLFLVPSIDKTNLALVIVAWIAQIAVSSGFYYWKAKAENLVKLPLYMLENLSEDMKEKADPNQIIATIVGMGHN